ncbi:hypothetical protein BC830DRAFT_412987 [Chytriomyces sp. MP71]|nr:hypothetical protein BC830DRAFT_412987 [Chytriomyces sp. MP71]
MPNQLANEKSPYLQQHASQPVEWHAWGETAFAAARKLGKPILLSVGYSTCHWCHVMSQESFENADTASLMNRFFVCIKVDREERPTVDRMFMSYVQSMTGSGGWPMTVLLTPDLKPFFGGTYFPPTTTRDSPAFSSVLTHFGEKWELDRDSILNSSNSDFEKLRASFKTNRSSESSLDVIDPFEFPAKSYVLLAQSYDSTYGGFGTAPKFPMPVVLSFLLTYHLAAKCGSDTLSRLASSKVPMSLFELNKLASRFGVATEGVDEAQLQKRVLEGVTKRGAEAENALNMVEFTLHKIAAAGIHDHIGGGFHRYAVDKTWHVPHFEKMLYDQAQLLSIYTDLYALTKDLTVESVCTDIINYLRRDLLSPYGGFYSAQDADSLPHTDASHAGEGAFAVWEAVEIDEVLGGDAEMFKWHYGINAGGNVSGRYDPMDEFTEKNIVIQRHSFAETAHKFDSNVFVVKTILDASLKKLWEVRAKRPQPSRDEKILCAWNGLTISSLAKAARTLSDSATRASTLSLAVDAAAYIRANMYNPATHMLLRVAEGIVQGYADDYAFLIEGLIELYQACADETWLQWAVELQATMDEVFWDREDGGYFTGGEGEEGVLLRVKDEFDVAEPAPASVAVRNLLRLDAIVGGSDYLERAEKVFLASLSSLKQVPRNMPVLVSGWIAYTRGIKKIVIRGTIDDEMKSLLDRTYSPLCAIAHAPNADSWLCGRNELIKEISNSANSRNNGAVYVCQDGACSLPVHDVDGLKALL